MTIFPRTPRSNSHYLIETTVQGIGRSVSRYSCLMLRSPFPRGGVLEDTFWSPWPRVLENWPALRSRTALFFKLLKFCGALEKFFGKRFFVEIAWKIFVKTFFFWRALVLVSLASTASVLGKAVLGLGFFCVLGLKPCVLDSTSAISYQR